LGAAKGLSTDFDFSKQTRVAANKAFTVLFAAPEQQKNAPPTFKFDAWAIGMIFYMLANNLFEDPFITELLEREELAIKEI
jgi:serine/threonine protein kinase